MLKNADIERTTYPSESPEKLTMNLEVAYLEFEKITRKLTY